MTNIQFVFAFIALFFLPLAAFAQTPITNQAELAAMQANGEYVLANDIDLSGEWTPLCSENPFSGVLDGAGHIIRNLKIDDATGSKIGFFARTEGATIKNLAIENANVKSSLSDATACAGILAGEASATQLKNIAIYGGQLEAQGIAGALVGRTLNNGTPSQFNDCYSSANIYSALAVGGGIAGAAINTKIENAFFSGLVESTITGGIVGSSRGDNYIWSCAVVSPLLKGSTVKRIVGEKKNGTLFLSNNYARADMMIGNRNLAVAPTAQTGVTMLHGANMKYSTPEFSSGQTPYTEEDADAAWKAFNSRFFSTGKRIFYENSTLSGKVAAVWVQAIYFDMAMNVFRRTGASADSTKIKSLFEGNRAEYAQFDWDVDRYPNGWFIYDDIMWWVIALARAYELTGVEQYLTLSQSGFERVWSGSTVEGDNGSYDDPARGGTGGMFWAWNNDNPVGSPDPGMGKMACINYPTVVGAMTLYNCTGNSLYLNRAIEIYDWARNNLFDKDNSNPALLGRVADSKHGTGNPAWTMHVYNQATCIGAAVMLYKQTGDRMYLDDAIIAADYTKYYINNSGSAANGFLDFETGVEQGIYHAIFSQYIARLIYDCGQYQYLSWLRYNIDNGWANRLISNGSSNNITYKDYVNPAPAITGIQSYDASGVPALMQVIYPTEDHADEVHCQNRNLYEKTLQWDFNSTWTWSENDSLPQLNFNFGQGNVAIQKPEAAVRIYSHARRVVIESPQPVNAEVYDVTGRLRYLKHKVCQADVSLPQGLYYVRTGADAGRKVVVSD